MADPSGAMRIDKFLWFARLARTRSAAQALAEEGHVRLDGRRVDRAHQPIRPGMVLTLARQGRVDILRVERLPLRRGPPIEAAMLVTNLAMDQFISSSTAEI